MFVMLLKNSKLSIANKNGLTVFRLAWSRAKKLNCIPLYAMSKKEKAKMLELYIKAQFKNLGSKTKYEVDHIIPLSCELVCGLHCAANLQILSKKRNANKGNKFQVRCVSTSGETVITKTGKSYKVSKKRRKTPKKHQKMALLRVKTAKNKAKKP